MNSSCSLMKSVWKVWLVLPLCLVFSLFLVNNTFAEVTDKVCKSLIAKADTAGEWSPAVTVCAGKNADGKVTLVSLGLEPNYFSNGAKKDGVAQATIDVDDSAKPERGVTFRGDGYEGVVRVGGLTGSATMGGSYKALDYSDPGSFASDVLSAGKDKVIQSNELVRVRHIPLKGGTRAGTCTSNVSAFECDYDFGAGKYDNAISNAGYSRGECEMVYRGVEVKVSGTYSYEEHSSEVICGATPAHDETVKYSVYIADEDSAVAEAATATPAATQPTTGEGEKDPDCMGVALSGQGWILCPTLENAASTADGFTQMIDGMLAVNPELYDNNSGTYEAWEIFRNFANILLSIILLVIIFSQITGYGINNYGIKKMLPKFVVMVVLINLSFVICQLAVDISNILGSGLNSLFKGIATSINGGETPGLFDTGNFISGIVANFIAAVSGVGAAAGAIIPIALSVGGGPLVIVSLALAALVALVSILMFFVMLGARMVIVVAFVAIAPLAFVCYILPNTQGLFKKWWGVLKAALIVYPICGALYGLSFVIKAIFIKTGTISYVWEGVVLIIAPFLPFLALPSLLKGVLSALGTVSGSLESIGRGIRGGIQSGNQALQQSAAFKNEQEIAARKRTAWMAGYDSKTGKTRELSRFGRFIRGGERGIAQARAQHVQDIGKGYRESSLTGAAYEAALTEQKEKAEIDKIASYVTLTNEKTRNGEEEGVLFDEFRGYANGGNEAGARAAVQIAGRRKDTAGRFMREMVTGAPGAAGPSPSSSLDGEMLKSVSKEITTGQQSKQFMAANPLGFEFAAQVNKGTAGTSDYNAWLGAEGGKNIAAAMDNYVTDSASLVGTKNDALGEIADLMESGAMDEATMKRMQNLAQDTIDQRATTGVWDSTKADNIHRIARGGVAVASSGTGSNGGVAQEGATINIDHSGGHGGSNPAGNGPAPTGNQTA